MNIAVIMIEDNFILTPVIINILLQKIIPKIEWMIARANGNRKNTPICLNKALLIIISLVPIFLKIVNFILLSLDSDNSFKARIAAQDIRKTIPRYNPMKVTIAPMPILEL